MTAYRRGLPQVGDEFFLTDGGIETTLIFLEGLELPELTVMGGCCGTDDRHIERIAAACTRSS